MKIVIDSNIVFSAILNTKSKIGQLIISGSRYFDFYSIGLLKNEIFKHKDKILNLTGLSSIEFNDTFEVVTSRIKFVDEVLLDDKEIGKAIGLVSDIDEDDAMFVALNNHLLASLWTGDKRLINGLRNKGYLRTITTDELYERFLDKQLKVKHKRK
jgi:predicted nucleic acid-binding protein